MEWEITSLAPDMVRAGIYMQGFMVMNLPLKGTTVTIPWKARTGIPFSVQDMFWYQGD